MSGHEPLPPVDQIAAPLHAGHTENCIRTALESKGIPRSAQAAALSELLQVTHQQVRRKLRQGIWTLQELLLIQNHYGTSLAEVMASQSARGDGGHLEAATILINNQAVECEVRIGSALVNQSGVGLACSRVKDKWVVSTFASLDDAAPGALRYAIEMLQVLENGSPPRIAVLDDDENASTSLASWFNHSGYPARAFTTSEALQAAGIDHFDVFVIDVILSAGKTCYSLLSRIRDVDPDAIVVLLTGKLRGNAPLETELANVVREQRVDFYEKPTRPPLLLASILNAVARRQPHGHSLA